MSRPRRLLLLAMLGATGLSGRAAAQGEGSAGWMPRVLGTQATVIARRLGPFDAPYSGAMSLVADGDRAVSHTYRLYVGARITPRLDGYLDVEMAR